MLGIPFTSQVKVGEIIGIGFIRSQGKVFITRNGKLVGQNSGVAFTGILKEEDVDLNVCIGLDSDPNGEIVFNYGSAPFQYSVMDINAFGLGKFFLCIVITFRFTLGFCI